MRYNDRDKHEREVVRGENVMNEQIDKKLARQIVDTVKDVCGQNVNFIDGSGLIYASTDESRIGTYHEIGRQAAEAGKAIEVESDDRFTGTQRGVNLPVYHNGTMVAVIGISGPPAEVRKYARLAERITGLLIREREVGAFSRTQEERRSYVINGLIRRERIAGAYLKEVLAEWRVDGDTDKRVAVIKVCGRPYAAGGAVVDQDIRRLFERAGIRLYTRNYPDEYLAVLEDGRFAQTAGMIRDFCAGREEYLQVGVGKATPLMELADSYESGLTALESLLGSRENYAVFDQLTLEILLSRVPESSREEFLQKTAGCLTCEEIELLAVYFEEDMSLAGASGRLFLHKNTLQYRLDRIARKSGFNPRRFRDAAVLYLAVKLKNRSCPADEAGQDR